MKSRILIFLVFLTMLVSQTTQSPFAVDDDMNNTFVLPQEFQKEDFNLNSDARIIKSISINYVTLDGSEKTMILDINKSIDWHNTYSISKVKTPNSNTIMDVSVTTPQKTMDSHEINASVAIEIPINSGKIDEFLSFSSYKNRIKFNTKDEMISDFVIGNPSKIVIDFKRKVSSPTKTINLDSDTAFRRVVFGSHKEYYRLVIYLDGKYNYSLEKDSNGYTLHLK